jgi:hypothetical protein
MIKFNIRRLDITHQFNMGLTKLVENLVEKEFDKYVESVVEASQTFIGNNYNWWRRTGDSLAGSLSSRKDGKNQHTVFARAFQAFWLQWGELASTGDQYIYPVEKDQLFINNTGLTSEEIKALGWKEFNKRYEYGVDWNFADRVGVLSMPYLTVPTDPQQHGVMNVKGKVPAEEASKVFGDYLQNVTQGYYDIMSGALRHGRWIRH